MDSARKKLNTAQAAARAGYSVAYLRWLRCMGGGPRFFKVKELKQGRVFYDADDIDAWMDDHKFSNTTEYSAAARLSAAVGRGRPPLRSSI